MIIIWINLGLLGALVNRVRGGWLKDEWFDGSTQYVRLVWSITFATVVFFGVFPVVTLEYLSWTSHLKFPMLVISGFVSWAVFGSGAHSIMNFNAWKEQWYKGNYPNDTEDYTAWLPWLFNGKPNATWSEDWFLVYHITGKSIEGALRHAVALSPIIITEPFAYLVFVLGGFLWGFLWYWAEILPRVGSLTSWNMGEIFTGFLGFFILGVMLYA